MLFWSKIRKPGGDMGKEFDPEKSRFPVVRIRYRHIMDRLRLSTRRPSEIESRVEEGSEEPTNYLAQVGEIPGVAIGEVRIRDESRLRKFRRELAKHGKVTAVIGTVAGTFIVGVGTAWMLKHYLEKKEKDR